MDEEHCPLNLLQAVLKNKKKAFRQGELIVCNPEACTEFSVTTMWPMAEQIPGFLDYMPHDWHQDNHRVHREYMWSIIMTLQPRWASAYIEDIRRQKAQRKFDNNITWSRH